MTRHRQKKENIYTKVRYTYKHLRQTVKITYYPKIPTLIIYSFTSQVETMTMTQSVMTKHQI